MAALAPNDLSWFLALAVVLCVALPVVPIVAYLWVGWQAKRNDITDGVSTKAKQCYLMMFSLSEYKKSQQQQAGTDAGAEASGCEQIFEDFYTRWYGRRHFILPVALFVAVLAGLALHVAFGATGYDMNKPAPSAIAGAYLWVSSDFISRARRLDFAPSDINWGTLRLVVAVPMGSAFAGLTGDVAASVVAFALGAFPLSAIQDMLRQTVYKWTTKTVPVNERNDALTKLQGVDDDIAIRMANEGITTIPQIAYCDPIRLVMRSNLTFNFVIDCMNQSLCWVYFEDQLKNLRPLGLRGAVEIAYLMNALESPDPKIQSEARATLIDVTNAIKPPHTEATLRYTFTQIAEDPYTHFLNAVWINPFAPVTQPGPAQQPRNGALVQNGHAASPM